MKISAPAGSRPESSKRHCSIGGASTLAPTEDVRQIDIKPNSDFAEANNEEKLIRWLELQELVKEQGCVIGTLQRRNRELESRLDSLEGKQESRLHSLEGKQESRLHSLEGDCHEMLAKQEDAQEEISNLALQMGELDEECVALGKGMPDRQEEVHDWLDKNRDYFEEYFKGRDDEISIFATDFARLKAMMREFSNG
ncbi:LysM domain-containing protein [Colletotrichum abscissum]|uniref:LysM domain-containing protein n=1 Tax=Colletotrichum abscissum TaxID=1671311 RepID=A0A9P9X1Y2_9PEZI|nr:LysM domain-containing protein [Colletotrichum abscissum]